MVKYEYIAQRLRELRKERGLSTKELGAMVNRSDKTIEAYEACISQPNADMLIDLCLALDVDLDVFQPPINHSVVILQTDDEHELLTLYRTMDRRAQADLLAIAHTLSARGKIVSLSVHR